jgi:hypothetical protein
LALIEQSRLIAMAVVFTVQDDSIGNVSILASDNIIGHCEKNKARMKTCLILIGYRDRAV